MILNFCGEKFAAPNLAQQIFRRKYVFDKANIFCEEQF
jgi:hypothetical protein